MSREIEILKEWPEWKREIASRLNDKGMSMKEASLKAGLGETFVRDALKRDKEPTRKNLERLRDTLQINKSQPPNISDISNLEVVGRAQAGAFLDVSVIDQDFDRKIINVAQDPRYPRAKQYALEVIGDSMNRLFDHGSYVTCVDWASTGLSLKPGMCLHVERHQGALVEVTVKIFAIRGGQKFLDPVSTNTSHKPIELHGDEGTEIVVRGLVTGSWKPITF